MDQIVIEGVPPWDGRYDLSGEFTIREYGWIKRFSGYLPLTVEDGWAGGDPELFCAFAVIALHRANRIQPPQAADVFSTLSDTEFWKSIRFEGGIVEEEEAEEESDPTASSSGNGASSGASSKTSSESSEPTPKHTGTPASVISGSVPSRSES